jgi:RNA-splicing ligase RtcB
LHGESEQRKQGGQGEGAHGEIEGAQGADEQLGSLCRGAHFLEVAQANARLGLRPDFECERTED